MKHAGLMVTAMSAVLLCGSAGYGFQTTYKFSADVAPSTVDSNNDGVAANHSTGRLIAKSGDFAGLEFTYETEAEFLPALATVVNCPIGTTEFPILTGFTIAHDSDTHTIVSKITSGYTCFTAATGKSTVTEHGDVQSGSGKWLGITGTFDVQGAVNFLLCDAAGRCFGRTKGTSVVDYTLP